MGIFGSKKLKITDSDFGKIKSLSIKENDVRWQVNKRFLDSDIEILIEGNIDGIAQNSRSLLF
jgi:hypothetical protein